MRTLLVVLALTTLVACNLEPGNSQPRSASGVKQGKVQVQTGPSGWTAEQDNVMNRLIEDNKPGSVKHLYVISAYSGQVIIYSTVKGKVTSGGKRLTPTTTTGAGEFNHNGINFAFNGTTYKTAEVLHDDGTYGHSGDYLYWWDTKGMYHQHYVSGGQIVHISNQPLAVKGIIINMELTTKP